MYLAREEEKLKFFKLSQVLRKYLLGYWFYDVISFTEIKSYENGQQELLANDDVIDKGQENINWN